MTHQPEIWDCIINNLTRNKWIHLNDIYSLIENKLDLDDEDFKWQSPSSNVPKWKRNVRNILQYRKNKKPSEIEWCRRQCSYRL